MTTMGTIESGHFDGHKNLNEPQRFETEALLEELLAQAKVDITALEGGSAVVTAPTLTPAAEAADVIAITFASPVAAVQQYVAEVIDTNSEINDAAFTLAETDVGAEVSPTAKARLIFTTDANGAAEISVTDVLGASGETVYVMIRPLLNSAQSAVLPAPVEVDITFD